MLVSLEAKPCPAYQDAPPTLDIYHELSSTKFLGTLRTMTSPVAYSPVPAPATPVVESTSAAQPKPLNPGVYRPASLSHHSISSNDGSSPRVVAKFIVNTVAVIRLLAIGFSIALVVLLFSDYTNHNPGVGFFIFLMFAQLSWQAFALLMQGSHRRRRSEPKKDLTLDLGCVKCIFAGRRRDNQDGGDGDALLGWVPGDAGKRLSRSGLIYTASDLLFAVLMFTLAMISGTDPWALFWQQSLARAVSALAGVLTGLEIIIAVAQQFTILKRAKIHVSYDEEEEDDIASPKYRIRLPQTPDRAHPAMSVAA
ncbi:uncharacterized protein CTRU02_204688 [Colletotrichum truncatum]|uniref:Uncharacterized protein n=1 Tax=Colletotrichum truncatum TaxID=5467 RepID=A0ACC3ZCR5_COLTU|nr:uncharacterized protein CTRU02_02920 [Colletotrichum truncatum]KAF6797878.1 hypothetical protein CTRU02_02920 [Colletotrichum truncatum]